MSIKKNAAESAAELQHNLEKLGLLKFGLPIRRDTEIQLHRWSTPGIIIGQVLHLKLALSGGKIAFCLIDPLLCDWPHRGRDLC